MKIKTTVSGTVAKAVEMVPENREDEKFLEILAESKHVIDVLQKGKEKTKVVTLVSI